MLLIDLKMLDETIIFYEKMSKDLQEQHDNCLGIMNDLFDNWQGTHADTYNEKFNSLVNGPLPGDFSEGGTVSLRLVKERLDKILTGLKEGQEVFQAEMNRCEELFYYGLTNSESINRTAPSSNTAYGGKLFIDYVKAEEIGMRLQSLLENECNAMDCSQNSQMGSWLKLCWDFDRRLRHGSYNPGSFTDIGKILKDEYTQIQNFWYSIGMYKKNLEEVEDGLSTIFGEQTSEYAKGMTRQIYEVSANGVINAQRIRYLSQKSPDSFTPTEMDEIHRILLYTTVDVSDQDIDALMLRSQQIVMQALFNNGPEKMDMDKLFRGYSAALHTKYAKDVSRTVDVERLSEYFYKDTLQRLTAADGSLNSDQLRYIMELNPDSLTVGDYKALSVVFDEQVAGVDMKSMEQANLFLANCYINEEVQGPTVSAERSVVFDQWVKYYLGQAVNKTNDDDHKALGSTKIDGDNEINLKFLKQTLLQIVSSNAALKLQLHGGVSPSDPGAWIPQMGIFEIEDLENGRDGDYRLSMYQSYLESGKKIEIKYYEYRCSNGMSDMLDNGVVNGYQKFTKDFLQFTKEKTADFIIDSITGKIIDNVKNITITAVGHQPVAIAIDGAVQAGKFALEWNEQSAKNKEIAENMRVYYDGQALEAYQVSGQIMYVNGNRIVNNCHVDERRLGKLQSEFQKQINPQNERYDTFFPKGCDAATKESIEAGLQDPTSIVYKIAYINWYFEGTGDQNHDLGKHYAQEE